jgi:O-antigen ligase/Flp pilus assembly protein TadD
MGNVLGNSETYKLPDGWFYLLFMGGLVAVGLFGIHDPLFLFGALSALLLLWRWRKNPQPFSWIDKAIAGILLYQILHIFFSIAPTSGFFAAKTFLFSVLFYFLLRTELSSLPKIEGFLLLCCILIALLCTVALATFLLFRSACAHVGFSGLYDFRHLYRPFGYLSNVWGSLLIGFAGMVLSLLHLTRRGGARFFFILLTLALLLWNVVVSFSRGVYLSFGVLLFLYVIFLIFSKIAPKRKACVLVALTLPVLAAGFMHREDAAKTLRFNRLLSQQRSISSRLEAMSFSYELLKKSPLTGYGAGTYPLAINEYRYENDHNSFSSFAPNGYTQLLTEQGAAGAALWGILFVALSVAIFRRRKDTPLAALTGIVLAAMLVREATFPVFWGTGGAQLLFFAMPAALQRALPAAENRSGAKRARYFPVAMLGIVALFCAYSACCAAAEQNNRKALLYMETGDVEAAEKYIGKTPESTPYLINRSVIYRKLYGKTSDPQYLHRAEKCLHKAAEKNPRDPMIACYRADVMREKGEPDAALRILTELTKKFPNKSYYQLATFDVLYSSNRQENARKYLLRAVKLSPGLLDGAYLKNILARDAALSEALRSALWQDIAHGMPAKDPVLLAKNGKISLALGHEKEAGQYLREAVALLPNLILPHYSLYKIEAKQNSSLKALTYLKQFVFLSSGAISKTMIDKTALPGKVEELFAANQGTTDNSYTTKFQTWYQSSTVFYSDLR